MDKRDNSRPPRIMDTDQLQSGVKDEEAYFDFLGSSQFPGFSIEQLGTVNHPEQQPDLLSNLAEVSGLSAESKHSGPGNLQSLMSSGVGHEHPSGLPDCGAAVDRSSGLVHRCKEDECESGEVGGDVDMKEEAGKDLAQDKSPRCKASPKRKARRPRTSSSSESQTPRDGTRQGSSPHRGEPVDVQNSSELSFKPPLLDEILTEKKLALMRSPDVVRFLQSQQAKLAMEKKLTNRLADDS